MKTIKVLPNEVVSKIAAGEVIERPASVVKELLENSIDAGADRISVKLEKGGKKLIRVGDNGVGMSKEDLLLCVERYATSKIFSLEDLFNIRTLGFRGEALPSIAAVSKMRITSKPHDQLTGYRIEIEGGKFVSLEEVGTLSGTVVDVKDLFFNLPARRKFLKSVKVEAEYILETVIRISLSYLNINFFLEHNGKTIFNLPPTESFISRFSLIFGDQIPEYMREAQEFYENAVVTAYLTLPEATRSKADRLFFYVNRRAIRSRIIMKAVMDAYSERLVKGEYPQGAVFIDIDPKKVDLNVHPTKQEVRFQEEHKIYEAVFSCIKKILHKDLYYGKRIIAEKQEQYSIPQFETPRIIGQLASTYILCENKNGLLLIDQHAAHERIIYEQLKKEISTGNIASQKLLEPYLIELGPADANNLNSMLSLLMNLGVEIEPFGENTFMISSYPSILKKIDWNSFIEDLLKTKDETALDNILKMMACHSAIKAGDLLSTEEMEALLEDLYKTELPTNCPHGRPIFKQISFQELERMFKRAV